MKKRINNILKEHKYYETNKSFANDTIPSHIRKSVKDKKKITKHKPVNNSKSISDSKSSKESKSVHDIKTSDD